MKKLTALLLALLMLALPVLGSAATTSDMLKEARDKNVPIMSVLSFEPADLSAMLGEDTNAIYSEILKALSLCVYSNGDGNQVGLDVMLQEESVFSTDLALGEDGTLYLNNNFLGDASIAVAPDDWQPLLEKLVDLMAAADGMSAEEAAAMKEQIAGMFSGEMVATADAFTDLDFSNMVAKAVEIASKAQTSAVTAQPEGCDHAVTMVTLTLTADDIVAIYTEVANTIRASEGTMAYLNSVLAEEGMTADALLDQLLAAIKETMTMVDGDVPMTMYMNAQGEVVHASMDMAMKAEEQNVVKFAYAYNRLTVEQGVNYSLTMQGYENAARVMDAGFTYLDAGDAGLVTMKMALDADGEKALVTADAVFDDNNLDATMKFEVDEDGEKTAMDVAVLYKNEDNKSNTTVTLNVTEDGETVGIAVTANSEDVPGDTTASRKGDLTLSMTQEGTTFGLKIDYTGEASTGETFNSNASYDVALVAMGSELPLLTANTFTTTAAGAMESIAGGETMRLATMSDEELTAYGTQIAQNAQTELIEVVQHLPASVLQLMMNQ